MSEAKPTPGPWDVIGPITKVAGGEPFFVVYAEDVQIVRLKLEANAHLISAAPDLLAAATAMLEAFGDETWFDEQAQALDRLMDAINKAEGDG